MALTFVNDAYSATATVTLPSFVAGDIAIVFAYRNSSTTVPSAASGWTDIATGAAANTNSRRIAYRVLIAGDTSVTFANATATACVVLRGQSATAIGASGTGGTNTTTLTTPLVSMQVTDGTSWVVAFAG